DIDERPEAANNRTRIGDWEADTMIGNKHKGALATLDERKSKLRLALPVSRKSAEEVTHAITQMLEPIKEVVLSITFDNGREFAAHEVIAGRLGCETYFAKPYHSWERGQNENANGLLRQYFPKSRQLNDVEVVEVLDAIDKLNSRPRKCLGYKTPYEVFEELTGITREKIFEGYALIT
ncbi:IS30 family transposase, partial [Thorsellia kenyensis]